jgi:hypothetical protein
MRSVEALPEGDLLHRQNTAEKALLNPGSPYLQYACQASVADGDEDFLRRVNESPTPDMRETREGYKNVIYYIRNKQYRQISFPHFIYLCQRRPSSCFTT